METQLIYVSKEKAEVKDPETGVFHNQVSQGIKVKQGDLVSVEGIAINSIGVGSDIVEIPEKTQNYDYYPNKMQLNSWIYIHHNYEYTCAMPFASSVVYNTLTDTNYGWLQNTGVPLTDFGSATPAPGATNYRKYQVGGKRLYVGRYSYWVEKAKSDINYANYDLQNPDPQGFSGGDPGTTVINVPGGGVGTLNGTNNARVFCPLRTDLTVSVDSGYDNPSNIANKITADFHSASVQPSVNMMPGGALNPDFVRSYLQEFNTNNVNALNQLTCSSQNSASLLIRGIPSTEPTWNVEAADQNAYYTSWIATANPFLHFYGSRLLTQHCTKNNTFVNARPGIAAPQTQVGEIVNLFTADDDGAGTADWRNGYVFTTNLAYNEENLTLVRDLLHSQKVDPFDVAKTTEQLNTSSKLNFKSIVSIGRNDDSATSLDSQPLQPKSIPAADFGAGVSNGETTTYYDPELYSQAYLSIEANTHIGVRIANDNQITFKGKLQYPEVISQLLDTNLVCVDTGVTGNNEMNIGIVMLAGQGEGANPPNATEGSGLLNFNNPILVNLQYKNPNNFCCMVLNPKVKKGGAAGTAGDQPGLMNLGSPNINMVFDSTRGRFALGNMSWASYTKATSTNPGGDQVIYANRSVTSYGSQAADLFLEYAQSGIGIVDLSVKNLSTDEWEVIDRRDEDDVKNKFGGSLWNRLGFEYNKFINTKGRPDAIFTERHYNSTIPLKDATNFPYPLTNNSQFDTAINISLNVGTGATNLPQFDLSTELNQPNIAITAETALTYATNLPQKLEFPYWLIQSDIIEGCKFNSENNGSEDNIVAMCNRAYLAGDFAFSFAPDYKFTATKDYVITSIKTRILNPDLSPAFISDKTAVIYKVESPLKMFTSYPKTPSASLNDPNQNGNDADLEEREL